MQVPYLLEHNEYSLRESADSVVYVRLIKTNGINTIGKGIFVHPATAQKDYVHDVLAILHDKLQRQPHKHKGPPTGHYVSRPILAPPPQ